MKERAAMFGVDLEKEAGNPTEVKKDGTPFKFADPSEYEHLGPEEKQALTDRMMKQHRAWADGKLKGNA
jgi:hypothetical protein